MPKRNARATNSSPQVSASPPTRWWGHASGSLSDTARPNRGELWLVGLLLLLGIGVRVAWPQRMSIEHFDEGVYASNVWFGPELGGGYPMRHLYAPALFPKLIEAAIITEAVATGSHTPSHLAVMAPSLFAGCGTILLVWWMGRTWFGRRVGLAAAALVATSDFHALYSRAALTDGLLLLLVVLAVWLLERATATGNFKCAMGCGVVTGLAWWTKYNGWLSLAIGITGIVGAAVFGSALRQRVGSWFVAWSVAAFVAVIIWSPYLHSLQSLGGYAAVSANHQKYVVGFGGWWDSVIRQFTNLAYFDTWLTVLGLLLAGLLAGCGATSRRGTMAISLCGLLAALWFGSPLVLVLLGAIGLSARLARRGCEKSGTGTSQLREILAKQRHPLGASPIFSQPRSVLGSTKFATAPLAPWLLLAWVGGLSVATPLYHPYPRLMLPWLCGMWLAAALGFEELGRWLAELETRGPKWGKRLGLVALLAAAGILWASVSGWAERPFSRAWQSRDGLENIAAEIARVIPTGDTSAAPEPSDFVATDNTILFVYGEPGLFFHLRARGLALVAPVGDLSFLEAAVDESYARLLITGPHAHRSPEFAAQLAKHSPALQLVSRYRYQPSPLVLLDQYPAERLLSGANEFEEEIRVYRVLP